jgi:hypothetical protein
LSLTLSPVGFEINLLQLGPLFGFILRFYFQRIDFTMAQVSDAKKESGDIPIENTVSDVEAAEEVAVKEQPVRDWTDEEEKKVVLVAQKSSWARGQEQVGQRNKD